jgi:hypothetical protein
MKPSIVAIDRLRPIFSKISDCDHDRAFSATFQGQFEEALRALRSPVDVSNADVASEPIKALLRNVNRYLECMYTYMCVYIYIHYVCVCNCVYVKTHTYNFTRHLHTSTPKHTHSFLSTNIHAKTQSQTTSADLYIHPLLSTYIHS